jgi:Alpha-glutamyl/putrescinyl thymine pyrophosphorylase clade 2
MKLDVVEFDLTKPETFTPTKCLLLPPETRIAILDERGWQTEGEEHDGYFDLLFDRICYSCNQPQVSTENQKEYCHHIKAIRVTGPFTTSDHADYRLPANRRVGFMLYYANALRTGDLDPMFGLIRRWSEQEKSSKEFQIWLAFLYSCCLGHVGTTFAIAHRFPDFPFIDLNELFDWCEQYAKPLAIWDRDYSRKRRSLFDLVRSYLQLLTNAEKWEGDAGQVGFLRHMIDKDNPIGSFKNVYSVVGTLRNVGRFCLLDYCEILIRCMDLPLQCDSFQMKEAKHPRAGLCRVLGRDDLAPHPSPAQILWLEQELETLIADLRRFCPDVAVDYLSVETVCCSYKAMWKGTRYPGYYHDSVADQIREAQKWAAVAAPGFDWVKLWGIRHDLYPSTSDSDTVNKTAVTLFRDSGQLLV